MEEADERLRGKAAELDVARASAEAAAEKLEASEARGRDLYEENKRLTEHISVSWAAYISWGEPPRPGAASRRRCHRRHRSRAWVRAVRRCLVGA